VRCGNSVTRIPCGCDGRHRFGTSREGNLLDRVAQKAIAAWAALGCFSALSMTAVELTFWLFRVGAGFDVGLEALGDEVAPDTVDELCRFLVDLAGDIYGDAKFRACGIG
jgi:hypothetical protein